MKNNQKSILLVALLATIISACNSGSGKVTSSQQTLGTSQQLGTSQESATPQQSGAQESTTISPGNGIAYSETDLKKMLGTALFNATSIVSINNLSSVTVPYLTCTSQGGFYLLAGCNDSTSVNTNESGDIVAPLSTISTINNNIYQILTNGQPMSGWYSSYSLGNENYNMDYDLNPRSQDLSNATSYAVADNNIESNITLISGGTNILYNPNSITENVATPAVTVSTTITTTSSTTTAWNFTFGEKSSLEVPVLFGKATGEVSWSVGVSTSDTNSYSTSITKSYTSSSSNITIPPNSDAIVTSSLNIANITGTYTTYTRIPDIIQFNSISSPDSSASHSLYVSLPAAFQSDPTDFSFLGTPAGYPTQGVYVKGTGNYGTQTGTYFTFNITIVPHSSASSNAAKSLNALTGNSNKKTYSFNVKAIPVPTN